MYDYDSYMHIVYIIPIYLSNDNDSSIERRRYKRIEWLIGMYMYHALHYDRIRTESTYSRLFITIQSSNVLQVIAII